LDTFLIDRLLAEAAAEAAGDARVAFERFVAEHPPEGYLWVVFLWQAMDQLNPSELSALEDKTGRPLQGPDPFDSQRG
jgi:hypothetical protein